MCKNKSNLPTTANEVFNFVGKIHMRIIFIVLFSISILSSCSIPEVQESKKGSLIIASDFLTNSDSLVFKNFEKRSKIKVYIKHLSTDSIIAHIKHFGYNSKFDGVLLFSSYGMNRLSTLNFLNDLPTQFSEQPIALRSPKNDWICVGLDPYVIDFGDSVTEKISYNELTYGKRWKPALSKEQSSAFYASVFHQFGRKQMAKSKTWLQAMKNHEISSINDSLSTANFTLNRHSLAKAEKNNFILPNQEKSGVFYDGIGIGILTHSRKYAELEQLISYLMIRHNNQNVMAKLNLFPAENPDNRSVYDYQNKYPKLFRCSPNKCVREYRDLERVLMKLK